MKNLIVLIVTLAATAFVILPALNMAVDTINQLVAALN